MSQLIHVAGPSGGREGTVIFVHGLGGQAYDTFRRETAKDVNDDETFWPRWVADVFPGVNASTFAYDAPMVGWFGTAMTVPQRASNLLETLMLRDELRNGPVAFVCHSLGGIIVKQMMLKLDEQKESDPKALALLDRIRAVVFIATPHLGAYHATLLDRFRLWVWPSVAALSLIKNDPLLTEINTRYRRLAMERKDTLGHKIFVETKHTLAGVIVKPADGDPGLLVEPVPDDKTHLEIARPEAPDEMVARGTLSLVAEKFDLATVSGHKALRQILAPVRKALDENYPVRVFRAAFVAASLTLAVGVPIGGYWLVSEYRAQGDTIRRQQDKIDALERLVAEQAQISAIPRDVVGPQIEMLSGNPDIDTESAVLALSHSFEAFGALNRSFDTPFPTETAEGRSLRDLAKARLAEGNMAAVSSALADATMLAQGDRALWPELLRDEGLLRSFQLDFSGAAEKFAESAALLEPNSPVWRTTLEDQIGVYALEARLFNDPTAQEQILTLQARLDDPTNVDTFIVQNPPTAPGPDAIGDGPVENMPG